MRTEMYDNSKSGCDTDDIKYAFECNGLQDRLNEIEVIVAEVCGENDGFPWHWILKLKNGKFCYATACCDYTGWDCISSAEISEPQNTIEDAVNLAPEKDTYGERDRIRETLRKQANDETPFAVYTA